MKTNFKPFWRKYYWASDLWALFNLQEPLEWSNSISVFASQLLLPVAQRGVHGQQKYENVIRNRHFGSKMTVSESEVAVSEVETVVSESETAVDFSGSQTPVSDSETVSLGTIRR